MMDLLTILISIRSLLSDPNPDSPANMAAAKVLKESADEYERLVRLNVEQSWNFSEVCDIEEYNI